MMDDNVQRRNESIKQRKLVRSIEQLSPVCDAYPVPPERTMHSTSQPHPSLPLPPPPLPPPPPPPPATASTPSATSSLSVLLSPTQTLLDEDAPMTNSPTSSGSPSATSPVDRSTGSAPLSSNTPSTSSGSSSTAITSFVSSGAKRTRSLMLKSTSPLQQTTQSSPSQALASPQGPPVPPRLSQKQSGAAVTPANVGPLTSNHPSIDPTLLTTHCNAPAPGTVTSSIITGTCYVTPPTPAPLSASDKNAELPSMTFGSVTPAGMSITKPELSACCNKTPTDGNGSGLRNTERTAEIVASNVRKKRDDFLKTTMKICLVVSPPSKLQVQKFSSL
uniref:Uncharacterized protein n=1 Tax=Anopheles maculatus TaxID=74869 RepID=A0A182SW76_9DIPT